MKKVEAVIRPHKLEEVYESIRDIVQGMTVIEAKGFGRQKGHSEIYRGTEYHTDFVPKIQLNIVCKDEDLDQILSLIEKNAKTGKVGDGKAFIYDIQDVLRIRTGERGEGAL